MLRLSQNTKIVFSVLTALSITVLLTVGIFFVVVFGIPFLKSLNEISTTTSTTTLPSAISFSSTKTTVTTSSTTTITRVTTTTTTTTTTTIDPCTIMNPSYYIRTGLNNYWTFCSSYTDIIGGVTLYGGVNAELTYDRFGNSQSALSLSNGYLRAPPGIYFRSVYTLMAWVKVRSYNYWSRLLDFGNGPANDSVVFILSRTTTGYPQQDIYYDAATMISLTSSQMIDLNVWQHLAFVFSYPYSRIFIDGVLVASSNYANGSPKTIIRSSNFIGKSNWPDAFANADIDELKIFERWLSQTEIQAEMNNNFNENT